MYLRMAVGTGPAQQVFTAAQRRRFEATAQIAGVEYRGMAGVTQERWSCQQHRRLGCAMGVMTARTAFADWLMFP